jgi:hypothetical protein
MSAEPRSPEDEDRHREAAALNHLLGEIGLSPTEQTQWWNHVAHDELDGRTPTAAWLAGDVDAVRALVERWFDASKVAAGRARGNDELLALLRERLSRLDDGPSAGIRRSA